MATATAIPRPRFARIYLKAAPRADRRGAAEHRLRLLAGLHGRVVEIGAGNGLNFAHYPTTVTEVIAIEPEPNLRAAAQQAADNAPVPVTVRAGTADRLPLRDGETDAAVASLQFLQPVELEAVIRAACDDALGAVERPLYLTAAMTGMRQGELIALPWIDVDWVARRIRVA